MLFHLGRNVDHQDMFTRHLALSFRILESSLAVLTRLIMCHSPSSPLPPVFHLCWQGLIMCHSPSSPLPPDWSTKQSIFSKKTFVLYVSLFCIICTFTPPSWPLCMALIYQLTMWETRPPWRLPHMHVWLVCVKFHIAKCFLISLLPQFRGPIQ